MNIKVFSNKEVLKKLYFWFNSDSRVFFEPRLKRISINLLRKIDIYYLFRISPTYEFCNNNFTSYKNIESFPIFKILIEMYLKNNVFELVVNFLLNKS